MGNRIYTGRGQNSVFFQVDYCGQQGGILESRNFLEQVSSWVRKGFLMHPLYVCIPPSLILSSHKSFTIEFIKYVFVALATIRCLLSVCTTLPKITGVKRAIAGDVVASEETNTHSRPHWYIQSGWVNVNHGCGRFV